MALKKSLGQHFLKDEHIAKRIVELLDIQPEDNILEIGPGAGALTNFIIEYKFNSFTVIEKDNKFAAWHKQRLGKRKDCHLIHADAMTFPWQEIEHKVKYISNLPYNIASPLIWDMVSTTQNMEKAVFMVQKEVGQRITAGPDNRDYGALSVWVQSFAKADFGFIVKPESFNPPPKVDSAIVILWPKNNIPEQKQALNTILRLCFQQRRKQIQSILKNGNIPNYIDILKDLAIDPTSRPENISPQLFYQLALRI